MVKKILCIFLFLCILFSFCACGKKLIEGNDKLNIVTTIFPAYDFCRQIVKDRANIDMLLSPGEEVHSFDPSPRDIVTIKQADLFIYNGGESDAWVDNILKSCPDVKIVKMMDCVTPFEEDYFQHIGFKKEQEEEEYDEHIWTSPKNALYIATVIFETLQQLDSGNREFFQNNFSAYRQELMQLDSDFTQTIQDTKNHTLIFADRFPLLYFVKEYDLDYYAAYPGCSGETESNPSVIAFLIDKIRENNIPAICKLELSAGNMAQTISKETGTEILTFYSCQTISKQDFENGETYVSLMTKNLDTLVQALN